MLFIWCFQSEPDQRTSHAGDNDTELSKTSPVSYVLLSGGLQQHAVAAHSAPNELLSNMKNATSPLSLGDRASTTTSISEARPTVWLFLCHFGYYC